MGKPKFRTAQSTYYEELIANHGKNIRDISNSDRIKKIIDQAIETRKPVHYDSLNTRNEGQRVWEGSTLTPIYNNQGKLIKMIIIDTDITERKDAEDLLKEKNKEILDSINYAKRLQDAILPSKQSILEHFPSSFVLYKPKDIVAGDFYWLEQVDQYVFFAVADCTGHGVPGAMVSVVCSNALNKAVMEERLTDPGEILDRITDLVIDRFGTDASVRDGMDISLCRLDQHGELAYAGAYSPLYLVNQLNEHSLDEKFKSATHWIKEIKANKQLIGWYEHRSKFTTHFIKMAPKQSLYLFTDGFYDQFGGPKGKKFKTANFKRLILKIHDKSMKEQGQIMDQTIEEWKGEFEQVDDICVIGIRI
ncbi:MAG: SpoIIE family protein phosphatase [Flavobacteriales bacterium]|nr:SpoIIE family protein phosphatase [Flavobacteriales bacterium]